MPKRVPRLILMLALLSIASGCAARRPPVSSVAAPPNPPPPPTEDVAALIRRGCFRCLEEAFATAQARNAPQQAFEAAALLALRAKELGMRPDDWIERARMLADGDGSWTLFLDIVRAVPADPLSGDRDELLATGPRGARLSATLGPNQSRALIPFWRQALQSGGASTAFRAYVDLALVCGFESGSQRDQTVEELIDKIPDTPLLQYGLGICGSPQGTRLAAVRTADADFVDADFPLARFELAKVESQDQEEAMRRLQSAAAAFPTSPAIATTMGNVYQAWEEWQPALAAFDAAIALVPAHPDALIGRTIALSNLARRDEAIETATRLINGGRWFVGQAYYWRAWNHLQLRNYDVARADADGARRLMVNAAVFVLSGLVDWRLRRLDTAEKDFQEAMTMDFGQCDAALYLGAVRSERVLRPEAIAAFNQARQCYDLAITVRRQLVAKIAAGGGNERTKARQIASQERAIAGSETRRAEAIGAIAELEKLLKSNPAPPRPQSQ